MIFQTPSITLEDHRVLEEIHAMRADLTDHLRVPRRWSGGLRRHSLAQAIRGSNSIEGYVVEVDDAAAAVDDKEPLSADEQTFAEIRGYRQALGYVLAMAPDDHFVLDASTVRSMHFMLLGHDLTKSPGRYRSGPIYVRDEATEIEVYEGPDADLVPNLVDELVGALTDTADDALVQAAMAHLNLVMIHPFRDGNGRLARALQTLVLARRGLADPTFASIEEWLGANTADYYRVLAHTGAGGWSPDRDAALWVSFNLRAHHMQAQTLQHRIEQAMAMWTAIDSISATRGLPDRAGLALYEAALGYRVRRATYVKRAEVEERTASRDLKQLVELELLQPVGATKGRYYVPGPALEEIQDARRAARKSIRDPYPWLPAQLAQPTPIERSKPMSTPLDTVRSGGRNEGPARLVSKAGDDK
ncbi:MAG: Fic family protein [Actinomycetia bacterium]|nr:Fic family protein [Actinomycetes bacterium]